MRLLIVTQKADRNDPILGFFHRWIEEFATQFDQVTVIAQKEGVHVFPSNVRVESLGKEKGTSIAGQIFRFWQLAWSLRGEYDVVLVHMTPIWVILGAPLWKLSRKPMYLWYEIKRGSWKLNVALMFVRKVFCATPHGLPRTHGKTVVTGHGIDTQHFHPTPEERNTHLISTVSRITPIKNIDVMLRAFASVPATYRFTIGGGPVTAADQVEVKRLEALINELKLQERVVMTGLMLQTDVRYLLQRSSVFLHACGGGLDKVVLEAMSCGCPVVSCSEAAKSVLPASLHATPATMGEVAVRALSLSDDERHALSKTLRQIVIRDHSLPRLIERLRGEMGS